MEDEDLEGMTGAQIRASFKGGDEQGNERCLLALVEAEGEGCLDVLRAVLEDTEEVGGIYSNLRNVALPIMAERFLGHPALEASLWKAIELDEYLNVDSLYLVVAAYDKARAAALLEPALEQGVPAALLLLAKDPDLRPRLLELLDKELVAGDPSRLVESLGAVADEPDLAACIARYVDKVPTAAAHALKNGDVDFIRNVATRLPTSEGQWRNTAIKALRLLPPAEAFELAATVITAPGRGKGEGEARTGAVLWAVGILRKPLDPRWLGFLIGRLGEEDDKQVRGGLVVALGNFGPDAAAAIVDAPRDDKDKEVLAELPDALAAIGPHHGVLELVRGRVAAAEGKVKKALQRVLEMFDA